jgi:hypothetical protein
MRITRRLSNAVAALIEKIRKSLAIRNKFRTAAHSCGQCYLPNLDNTAEVLAVAEGERFK